MSVERCCRRDPVTVSPEASVREAAPLMQSRGVGMVVVDEAWPVVGIVTDRDLLRRVVLPARDPDATPGGEVMSGSPVTADCEEPLEALLARMVEAGIRRRPVLEDGRLAGLVRLDGLVSELARELGEVREAIRGEVLGPRRAAPARRRRERLEASLEELRSQIGGVGRSGREWLCREIEDLRRRIRRDWAVGRCSDSRARGWRLRWDGGGPCRVHPRRPGARRPRGARCGRVGARSRRRAPRAGGPARRRAVPPG